MLVSIDGVAYVPNKATSLNLTANYNTVNYNNQLAGTEYLNASYAIGTNLILPLNLTGVAKSDEVDDQVYLQGVIYFYRSQTSSMVLATLPEALRPSKREMFATAGMLPFVFLPN